MTSRLIQTGIQFTIVGSFFLKTFNNRIDGEGVPITGFEALLSDQYYVIGNVFIWTILLGSLYHLICLLIALMKKQVSGKLETSLVIVINLQLFFGLFLVTFLGWAIEPLGLVVIGLIVLGAYVKYKFKT